MTVHDLAGYMDLSLLRPDAGILDIEILITEAHKFPFASVCIPPCHVRPAARMLGDSPVKVCTVVGFPLGYQTTEVKVLEACEAVDSGAEEIDMMMNISMFKSGGHAQVQDEISEIVSALPGVLVKVIIETCYLTDMEKAAACELVIKGGADFVKTSTGFGPVGATVEDVRLLAGVASGRVKVKASGGIKNLDDALRMIEAGAARIGTSAGGSILEGFKSAKLT